MIENNYFSTIFLRLYFLYPFLTTYAIPATTIFILPSKGIDVLGVGSKLPPILPIPCVWRMAVYSKKAGSINVNLIFVLS